MIRSFSHKGPAELWSKGTSSKVDRRLQDPGKLCGNGPKLWLNMQMAHDLWEAEQKVDVSGIPTLEVD